MDERHDKHILLLLNGQKLNYCGTSEGSMDFHILNILRYLILVFPVIVVDKHGCPLKVVKADKTKEFKTKKKSLPTTRPYTRRITGLVADERCSYLDVIVRNIENKFKKAALAGHEDFFWGQWSITRRSKYFTSSLNEIPMQDRTLKVLFSWSI